MATFGVRLRDAMIAAGQGNTLEFALQVPISVKTLRKWLSATRLSLSGEHLVRLSALLGVRIQWLAVGDGPMLRTTASEYSERDMLGAFRLLSKRQRVLVRDIVGAIVKNSED